MEKYTDLFKKNLNLYLYIPPSSYNSSGVINGIILGGVHRIYRIYTDKDDIMYHLINFKNCLIARGNARRKIIRLFRLVMYKEYAAELDYNPEVLRNNTGKNKM